jgi:3',5'-cyclic AMP phosphodiesterase CpdA
MRKILPALLIPCALSTGCALLWGADEPFIGPYVQGVGRDSALILWETETPSEGEVDWGESETGTRTAREVLARTLHAVPIAGLRPDTRYVYRVRWEKKASAFFSFRTLPPEGTRRLRLAVYGDSRSNPAVHSAVARRILDADPDVVIHTGDIVADGTRKEQWKPQFFDPARELLARKPVVTSLGNHEKDARHYYEYFPAAGNVGWFSYRWAHVHFIVLDTQKPFEPGSEQYAWLEKELRTPDAEWRLVYFHYPMFSCHPTRGINANRWAWQDLFDRHGVDLVLTGHDHYYHRTHRIGRAAEASSAGVYHITSAGGGASLYPVEVKPYTAAAESVHHFLMLELDGGRAVGTAIGVDGRTVDAFSIDRTAADSSPFVSYEMALWERALVEAIDKIEPAPVEPGAARVERRLELPGFLPGAQVAHRWIGGSSYWAAGESSGVTEQREGQNLALTLWGEGPVRAMYPLPRLELRVLKPPPGCRDFVNRALVLDPLRIAASRLIRAPRFHGKVQVDGKLAEADWATASVTSGFTRSFGRFIADGETLLLGHDEVGMVVGARVRSLADKPLEKGAKERDTRHMFRTDEALTIVLTSPAIIPITFFLCGNSRGTKFDSLTNATLWNPDWEFAAAEIPGGWSAEARIPWKALGLSGPPARPWRINFFRWDTVDRALSEWAPTFSAYGTSRKHDGRIELVQ